MIVAEVAAAAAAQLNITFSRCIVASSVMRSAKRIGTWHDDRHFEESQSRDDWKHISFP